MRRIRPVAAALLLAAAPAAGLAQDGLPPASHDALRWTLAVGPTGTLVDGDGVFFLDSRPHIGADEGIFHAALGAAWMIPGSALELRGELLYNHATSYKLHHWGGSHPTLSARMAHRDQTLGAGLSVAWHAFPSKRWSPYLVTGTGWYGSFLGVSTSDGSTSIDRTVVGSSAAFNAGAGLRFPVLGQSFFVEMRYHDMVFGSPRGSDFMPVTVGWRL